MVVYIEQKDEVRAAIARGKVIKFKEGEIQPYLYEIWARDKIKK
jgi:hypothetical protein